MNVERTCRWTRMFQSRVRFSSTAALPPSLFLADCIINIAEFEFSIGTGIEKLKELNELSASMAIPDQGVNLTGEQIDAANKLTVP